MSVVSLDTLNELMQEEISAVATYAQAERKASGHPIRNELKNLRAAHAASAQNLKKWLPQESAPDRPADEGRVWQSWRRLADAKGSSRNAALLEALIEGEEFLASLYEDAMRDDALDFSTKQSIDSQLIPRSQAHLDLLERLRERCPPHHS